MEDPLILQQEEESKTKRRKVDLGIPIPEMLAKEEEDLKELVKQADAAITVCTTSVTTFNNLAAEDKDAALGQFHSTCLVRLRWLVAWKAATPDEVPDVDAAMVDDAEEDAAVKSKLSAWNHWNHRLRRKQQQAPAL